MSVMWLVTAQDWRVSAPPITLSTCFVIIGWVRKVLVSYEAWQKYDQIINLSTLGCAALLFCPAKVQGATISQKKVTSTASAIPGIDAIWLPVTRLEVSMRPLWLQVAYSDSLGSQMGSRTIASSMQPVNPIGFIRNWRDAIFPKFVNPRTLKDASFGDCHFARWPYLCYILVPGKNLIY